MNDEEARKIRGVLEDVRELLRYLAWAEWCKSTRSERITPFEQFAKLKKRGD